MSDSIRDCESKSQYFGSVRTHPSRTQHTSHHVGSTLRREAVLQQAEVGVLRHQQLQYVLALQAAQKPAALAARRRPASRAVAESDASTLYHGYSHI